MWQNTNLDTMGVELRLANSGAQKLGVRRKDVLSPSFFNKRFCLQRGRECLNITNILETCSLRLGLRHFFRPRSHLPEKAGVFLRATPKGALCRRSAITEHRRRVAPRFVLFCFCLSWRLAAVWPSPNCERLLLRFDAEASLGGQAKNEQLVLRGRGKAADTLGNPAGCPGANATGRFACDKPSLVDPSRG